MDNTENMMLAAVVGSPKGLRGEVNLNVRTDRADEVLAPGNQVFSNHPDFPVLTVERLSFWKGRAQVFFSEVTDRDASEALRGSELLVPAELEEDAWYGHELEGLTVVNVAGDELGVVRDLDLGEAQDRLVVDTANGTVMVPFVEELVPEVDLDAGKVIVDPPEGLFE